MTRLFADSKSFLSPYEILLTAQENEIFIDILGYFFSFYHTNVLSVC